ncbi:MAG: MFS transporter, partial [Proteobacteria bacterium]|nr:MFS transporter [Pseudomonadota bacterium]
MVRGKWRTILSWSLYDWANSAFATTVMAGFFPLFFKKFWSAGVDSAHSTFQLGLANSLGSIVVVILAPALGAIADKGGSKKHFLLVFAGVGVLATAGLYAVGEGLWPAAAALYVAAAVGFSGGNIFYDALLVSVTDEDRVDFVSALGFSLGYLGGGLLFAFNVAMVLAPETFGLADATEAVRVSFLTVAAWWALFSVPLFLFVDEPRPGARPPWRQAVVGGFRQLAATFREVRRLR